MLIVPVESMTYEVRCSLGLLVWMSWWWITRPVHLAVTGFLPLAVVSVFDFAPIARILPAYATELIILLLSANILTTAWTRWGLDRRIALASLIGIGTNTTRQILAWFAIGMILSAFLPNTIVAATMIPIVVAMLRFVGIEDLWESNLGTALVIAVAWGTSAGGAMTPLGGAPNLLTIEFIQETVTGMKVVQLFTREERNLRDFEVMNADHRDAWKKSIPVTGRSPSTSPRCPRYRASSRSPRASPCRATDRLRYPA